MTEQQAQLKELLEKKAKAAKEYSDGEKTLSQLRDLILKLEGAIEAFTLLGITLDEND